MSALDGGTAFKALGVGLELGGETGASAVLLSSSGLPAPASDSSFAAIGVFAFLDRRQKKNITPPIRARPPTTPTTAPTMTPVFVEAGWVLAFPLDPPFPLLEPLLEPSGVVDSLGPESPVPEPPMPKSPESEVGPAVSVGPEEAVLPLSAVCDAISHRY